MAMGHSILRRFTTRYPPWSLRPSGARAIKLFAGDLAADQTGEGHDRSAGAVSDGPVTFRSGGRFENIDTRPVPFERHCIGKSLDSTRLGQSKNFLDR